MHHCIACYLNNQWSRFAAYLDDPAIPIDNNRSENSIRVRQRAQLCTLADYEDMIIMYGYLSL